MKKGFTLVELLSVMIILSIVGIVTVPYILNYIEKSKISSYKTSVQTVMESAKEYVSKYEENNDFPADGINIKQADLNLKKDQFINGIIKRNDNGEIVAVNVYDGEYCANGTKQNLIVEQVENEEECNQIDSTAPTLKIKATSVTASSIMVVAIAQDSQSGVKDYKYCIGDDCSEYTTKNNYEFKNLKAGQIYQITVTVRNNNYGKDEQYTSEVTEATEKIKVTTNVIGAPEFKISSSSYGTSKIVEIIYPENNGELQFGYIIYDKDNKVLESKKVNENIELTINQNGRIKAYILYNGQEISNELTIIGIDNKAPEVYVIMDNSEWSRSRQIEIILKDENVGLAKEAYSYDNGETWTSNNKRTYTSNQEVYIAVRDKLGNKTTNYKLCKDNSLTDCSENTNDSIIIENVDINPPELSITSTPSTTNSVVINYNKSDSDSGIKEVTCKYRASTETSFKTVETGINSCLVTGLKNNTIYYFQLCAYDNAGNSVCNKKTVKTSNMTKPTMTYTNTPTASVNEYFKQQIVGVTFYSTNITSPQYFIKTTKQAQSNVAITQSCENDELGNPINCKTITSTKILSPNTWYKVEKNVSVGYLSTSDQTGKLIAITYDGTNYSSSTTGTISKIDTVKPTCTVTKSSLNTTTGITATFTCDDANSGVQTCPTTQTGLKANASYTVRDKVGNTNTCSVTVSSKTQYRKRACSTGKACSAAGCSVYNSCANGSACGYTYSCSSGTLSGTNCVTTSTSTKAATKKCSNGYNVYNSTCYIWVSDPTITYSCKSSDYPVKINTSCYAQYTSSSNCATNCGGSCSTTDAGIGKTIYYCASKKQAATKTYSCPSGGEVNSTKTSCVKYNSAYLYYTCSSGTLSGTNCIITTTTTTAATANAKSCPNSSCTCATYKTSIETCECSTWGSYTAWSDTNSSSTYCTTSNSCEGQTQVIYY